MPPQVLHLIPRPFRRAGGRVEGPECRLGTAEILALVRVDGHGQHVHGAVVVAGGHVDALTVVADQGPAPQLPAGGRRERDRGAVRRRVNGPADDIDAVRAAVQRVVVVRPQDLAGGEPDRHHVRLLILGVHHAIHHDRRRRVTIRQASGTSHPRRLDRHAPCHSQRRHIRAGNRAGDVPGVRQVAARQRPGRRHRRIRRRSRRAGGLACRCTLGRATCRIRFGAARTAADGQAGGDRQDHAGNRGPVSETPHATHLLDCRKAPWSDGAAVPSRGAVPRSPGRWIVLRQLTPPDLMAPCGSRPSRLFVPLHRPDPCS